MNWVLFEIQSGLVSVDHNQFPPPPPQVVWGPELKEEVFERWSQGFHFSEDEPAALVQEGGGPCAVITPVQVLNDSVLKSLQNDNLLRIDHNTTTTSTLAA